MMKFSFGSKNLCDVFPCIVVLCVQKEFDKFKRYENDDLQIDMAKKKCGLKARNLRLQIDPMACNIDDH